MLEDTFEEIVTRLAATQTIQRIAQQMSMSAPDAVRMAIRMASDVAPDKVAGEFLRIAEDHVVTQDELLDFANLILEETRSVRFFDIVAVVVGEDHDSLPEAALLTVQRLGQPNPGQTYPLNLTAHGEEHPINHRVYFSLEEPETRCEITLGKPDRPGRAYRLHIDPNQRRIDVVIGALGEFRYRQIDEVAIPYPNQREYLILFHFQDDAPVASG